MVQQGLQKKMFSMDLKPLHSGRARINLMQGASADCDVGAMTNAKSGRDY
jgi:hypothetical protein